MSHILEDELHAYLDQALSRSRCVTIESHLANCAWCSSQRDAIAALRDQTTLLLGTLAPSRRIPVSLEELNRRQLARAPRRQRARRALWAASVVGALGLGYGIRSLGSAPRTPEVALAPVTEVAAIPGTANQSTGNAGPVVVPAMAVSRRSSARPAVLAAPGPDEITPAPAPDGSAPPSVESSTSALPTDADPGLQGLWRTVPWDNAQDVAGKTPARIDGVPVEEVQIQPSRAGGSPMMVVAQRLSSGEVIQTIEGPAADVSQLLARRGDGGLDSAGRPAEAMQRGDRMLVVTGELPPDSLRAMMRRMNAAQRVK
jgi:anti-sigma factor RsiW